MSKKHLLPPWRDLRPDGTLGPEYGPGSLSTYQRHLARHKDWSYRPPTKEKRYHRVVREFMTLPDGSVREEGVSDRELFVYLEVVVGGVSMYALADRVRVKRETIRCYLRRLHAKALRHRARRKRHEQGKTGPIG